ncbi:MAG: extracellular solute-binding protein [bacterium]|nr:extracellular solute-binding protein [bacterium]
MRLRLPVCLVLILIAISMSAFTSYAKERPLVVWIMPNESPISHKPSDKELEEFLAQNLNVKNTLSELKSDRDFAKAVLGQTEILKLIKRYKQEKKGEINIRVLKWSEAFGEIEDAITAYKKKFPPDIIQLGSTWNAYFANKGALVEITKYVDEHLYFESSIKSCRILGSKKIYALPLNVDVRILYYWKDIIENPEVELKDWKALKRVCQKTQKAIDNGELSGIRTPIGFPVGSREGDVLHQFAIWLWGAGGEITKVTKKLGIFPVKEATLDSKEALESAIFLKELTKESNLPQITLGELEEQFMAGKTGIIISGGWLVKRLKDRFGEEAWKEKIGVALPPAGPAGKFTFVGGCNLSIFKATKERGNFEQAKDFLLFLSGKEAQLQYGNVTGALPGLKEAMDVYIKEDPSCQIFKEALEYGKSYPSIPEWATVVEKEVTLNNLYRLWQDIRKNVSDEEIKNRLRCADRILDWELFRKKILVFTICLIIGICLLAASILILRAWLEKRRIEKENRELNLKIKTKEAEIEAHKSTIHSYDNQIQKLTQEKEELILSFKAEKIETDKFQSDINKFTSEIQKLTQEKEKLDQENQKFESWINKTKSGKYAVTISYKAKKSLKKEDLLEHLLKSNNELKIEIEDNYHNCLIDISNLEQEKYRNEKKLFVFIAYFTDHYKDKEIYTSPGIITKDNKTSGNKTSRDWTAEETFYKSCIRRDWGEEKEYFSSESIKRWVTNLRTIIFKQHKDIFPESKKGYRINASIKFLPEK